MEARVFRRVYRELLPRIVQRPVVPAGELSFSVFSFSGERDLPEQVASLRSFLRYAGRPVSFTVVSDDTHSPSSRRLLRRVDPCVEVANWERVRKPDLPARVHDYAQRHPMGKKLAVELSLRAAHPIIYADADVLFFAAARALASLERSRDDRPRYLRDCEPYLDDRLLLQPVEANQPVNGGFFILYRPLEWGPALHRLARLQEPPDFFTEQTLLHLTMHCNEARPLDPERYVVSVHDRLRYRDQHARRRIVLRHYTSPVRHKFWCSLGRSLLSRAGAAATSS